MKIRWIIRSLLAAGAAMALALGCAAAEEVSVTDVGLGLGDNRVGVPVVSGMADEALQLEINRRLQDDLGIDGYLTRMALQISEESVGIRTDWEGGVRGDVLSLRMAAEGSLENTRSTYAWTSANIDLRDGHEIALDELFTDGEAARAAIEEYLEWEVAPELSAHLESSELLPLPEKFYLDEAGLTLLYPVQQLSTLSEQTEDNFTWSVTRINQLEEDLQNAHEATEEELAIIRTYMTFGDNGLIIGKTGNPFTFRVVNDRLAFYMNDTEVAYLSNNKLYVTQAEILTKLIIGNG